MRRRRTIVMLVLVAGLLGVGASAIDGLPGGGEIAFEGAAVANVLPALAGVLREAPEGQPLELRVPGGEALRIVAPQPYFAPEITGDALRAHAYEYISRVYGHPARRPRAIGLVRRGSTLAVEGRVHGPGCDGAWYTLAGGGLVCTGEGFAVSRAARERRRRQPPPDVTRAMPFEYGRVNTREALRFYRIPTRAEEAEIARALAQDHRLPDVVQMQLDGDYFVAIDRLERDGEREFYRTIRGRYVRKSEVDVKPEPAMHGELLGGDVTLPLAFVYGEEPGAPLLRRRQGRVEEVGTARVHSRFAIRELTQWGDREVVMGPDGLAVERQRVRIARVHPPPEEVGAGEKWVHIDLDEQALVAYEGARPVFATLVSSGREDGYATPRGLFRVREKHISTTMRGEDPVEGPYEVGEVPWTMYYWESYALHGAYWHDTFGKRRSHGCTNLSPVDARWLFHFTADEVPQGWHARRQLKEGTWVYFTRSDA